VQQLVYPAVTFDLPPRGSKPKISIQTLRRWYMRFNTRNTKLFWASL